MNPYLIETPFSVSFSGGRTSGYMLRKILDAYGGELPKDGHVLFGNTGNEMEETLAFIHEVETKWCPVTWLEWQKDMPKFKLVNYTSASRKGEPFAALIESRNYIPNPVARFCTSDLKVKSFSRYMRTLGYDEWNTCLGLRADERRRVSRIKGDTRRDNVLCPLNTANVVKEDVISWWSTQEFDLRLPDNDQSFGNCDMCFLKARWMIERVMIANPERAQWWIDQEAKIGATFRSDRPSYKEMFIQITTQGRLFDAPKDESTMPCDCTE